MAQYAAELLSHNDTDLMLRVFEKYGASSNPANFNIYKAILDKVGYRYFWGLPLSKSEWFHFQIVAQSFSTPSEEFCRLSPVRDLFLSVYEQLVKENSESRHVSVKFTLQNPYIHA